MPLRPEWKAIAKDQPDSRVAGLSRNEKKHLLLGWMEECFCCNCGKPQGMVSKEWAAYMFILCDDCVFTHGALPLPEIPEAVAKGKVPR
jgi:hypothetical protein